MKDENKTKEHLITELGEMRQRITELEASESEHKQVEVKFKKTQGQLRNILESISEGVAVTDVELRITDINEAGLRMFGYNHKEELIGRSGLELVSGKERARAMVNMRRTLEKGHSGTLEYTFLAKDGKEFLAEYSVTVIKGESGNPVGFVSTMRDVSERRKAEEALRNLSQQWQSTFNAISDAICLLNSDCMILRCNNAMGNFLGKQISEIEGHTCWELVHGSSEPIKGCPIMRMRETRCKETLVLQVGNQWLEVTTEPLQDNDGDIIGAVHIMSNITERKQIEEERQRTSRLESVGTLAGGIAHDFNNLLTGITGYIGLAKRSVERGEVEKASDRLEEAEKASMQARDLTQQLLTFAKGGAPVKQVISIANLIRDSATFNLRGSNVRCDLSLPDDLRAVEVDEGQMSQVISNIVINADEAIPGGGVLTVKAQNTVIDEKSTLPLSKGKYIEIVFEDHGVGISKEHLDRIFEPYFTTKQKGSGLGLAAAHSIVKNHNGYITAKSELGVGTTFYIYLPASEKRLPVKKEAVAEAPVTGRGRILVMDDQDIIRQFLLQELTEVGYEVEVSSDGAEAIELYKQAKKSEQPFDAVILDLTVPGGMGGKQAIKKLLEIDPEVKAIVSSGYATDLIMAEFEKYGFKGVVAKPYNIAQLEEKLHELLSKTK